MARHQAPDHRERIEEMEKEFKEGMDAIDDLDKKIAVQVDNLVNLFSKD